MPEHTRSVIEFPAELRFDFVARMFSRINVAGADECWEWKAGRVSAGYGAVHVPRDENGPTRQVAAHRLVCHLFHGPPKPDQHALHSCDNPPCCNPRHLRWGTHLDNMGDKSERGRAPATIDRFNRSEANQQQNNPRALSPDQALAILRDVEAGGTDRGLGRKHGVSATTVRKIREGRHWVHQWECA